MKYGPETATVEAFIQHLKAMTPEQWRAADAAGVAAVDAAWDAAGFAAVDAAGFAAVDAAGFAAWAAARGANEIQGAALMRERGQPFFFLPMFGFADPEAVVSASHSAG
jgi:hypothetical protein